MGFDELSFVSIEFVGFDVVNVHRALYTPHHCVLGGLSSSKHIRCDGGGL